MRTIRVTTKMGLALFVLVGIAATSSPVIGQQAKQAVEAIDLTASSDAELLALAKASFADPNRASDEAPKYDSQVAERLRFLIRHRKELSLNTEEMTSLVHWVGQYKGTETTSLLIELLEEPLKPVISVEDLGYLFACQNGLGYEGATLKGLEYLKEMTTEDYWLKRNAQPQCPENPLKSSRTPTQIRNRLRNSAHHAFYLSGTQYALDALRKGEGFPADVMEPPALDYAIEYCEACLRGERPELNMRP